MWDQNSLHLPIGDYISPAVGSEALEHSNQPAQECAQIQVKMYRTLEKQFNTSVLRKYIAHLTKSEYTSQLVMSVSEF
jgi:hypothetical protein